MPMRFPFRFLPFLFFLPPASLPLGDLVHGGVQNLVAGASAREGAQQLNALFYRLRRSESGAEASQFEAEIFIRLTASASPTVNLLLENANIAMSMENDVTARAILDDVVALDPNFAEGLTRAAALAYQDGDLDEAQALLIRALRIEPRHFGAWAGLGLVREDLGDLEGAQQAYREALYLHPFLDAAKRGLIKLEAKTDGLSL
jgi:tetratricopeptide (TPR) repeat protein